MCGIFGFTDWNTQTDRLFPIIADEMESRGSSSWGTTNGDQIYKKLGAITKTIEHNFRGWEHARGLIFHTRAPSAGTGRTVDDAHPFMFYRILDLNSNPEFQLYKGVVGIHNGYVSNNFALKNKYEDRKDFSVDSMHIFKHLCDGTDTAEITGSGAIAWYETIIKRYTNAGKPDELLDRRLFLARFNTDSLHIGRIDTGEMVFASTKEAIEKAARLACTNIAEYYTIKDNIKYELLPGSPASIKEIGPLVFGKASDSYSGGMVNGVYQAPGACAGNFPHRSHDNRGVYLGKSGKSGLSNDPNFDLCPGCDTKIDPTTRAICDDCLEMWIDELTK